MASEKAKYKTEPFKIWDEAKRLRDKFFQDYVEAKEKGGINAICSTGITVTLASGLGEDVYVMGSEPLAGQTAHHRDFSLRALETCEKRRLGTEICGYTKNVLGSMMLEKFIMPDGTMLDHWPIPDFITSWSLAPCHTKWFQLMSEYKNIPQYAFDLPRIYPRNDKSLLDYLTAQGLDAIEWMEHVTKRKYNDELLIQGVKNETRAYSLWTKIMTLNQNIPAPMDEKTIFSFVVPSLMRPYTKEVGDFYQRLLEEVQDRVDRGIAAAPNERFRIITDAIPPWSYLSLWRYMEREYGVVSIGSPYVICLIGSWMFDNKRNLMPTPTPEEAGMPLTTREEAVRAVMWYRTHFSTETLYSTAGQREQHEVTQAIARQWQANGGILHVNRGCTMQALGAVEGRRALMETGLPAMNFEGNDADPRDLNYALTKRQIDMFLESLGLKRLAGSAA